MAASALNLFVRSSWLSAVVAGLVGCAASGAAAPHESVSPTRATGASGLGTSSPYPQRQDIEVTVGGLVLKGHCSGVSVAGKPTVVMTLGNGQTEGGMSQYQELLAKRTRVCAYNRAGIGGSQAPSPLPRPVGDVVEEMHGFLRAAQIPPPYFLVGGSAGGVVGFMFAQAHPQEVAGFVLSNPMPPPYSQDMAGARRALTPSELRTLERPDYLGDNPERIDFRGNDSMLTHRLPAAMRYAILFDENCGGDSAFCKKVLTWLPALEASLAKVGAGGSFEWIKGAGHDIPGSRPAQFTQALETVWASATTG